MAKTLTQKLALTGTGLVAAFALAACGSGDGGTNQDAGAAATTPAASAAESTAAGAAESTAPASASASADQSDSSSAPAASSGAASGEDAAFGTIDTVLAEYSGGIITELDLDDDDQVWEVDVVVNGELLELDVTADGQITETDREGDEDDVQKAERAEVLASAALKTALDGRDGQTVDEADLNEDDGRLEWDVELDREDGSDGDEITIDAMTGEVIEADTE